MISWNSKAVLGYRYGSVAVRQIKVVISIKYGWNTITWAKVMHLGHFVQNVWRVKIHTSSKISKFCWQKIYMGKIVGIWLFLSETTRLYRYYQSKYQLNVTSSSYTNLTMKLLVKLYLWTQKQGKSEILMFFGKLCISHFLWHNFPYFSSLNLIIRTR